MNAKTITILLLSVVLLMSAFTQVKAGVNAKANTSTQLGYGLTTCGQYNQLRKQDPVIETIFNAWVLGYLSGVNFIVHTTKGVDFLANENADKISGFIKGYCAANPEKTVTEAANEYWFSFMGQVKK